MTDENLGNVWPEWQIVRQIGRGTYGVVYEAVRRKYAVESHAAIKVISIPQNEAELNVLRSEGMSEDSAKTYLENVANDFSKEISLMEPFKGIQNIVSVEDYEVVEKEAGIGWDIYIRMELLTPFSDYIRDREMTEKEIIKLGVDICTALEFCAKQNIIHRDIKPGNIFVNRFGDFKLGDFGIARKLENVTGGLSYKGTYNYMAPEIEKGAQYDATVDLYSLGLVLYRLMNRNCFPFMTTEQQFLSPNERMAANRRRMDGELLPAPCNASPAMAKVILRACHPDAKKRFPTAVEMKSALISVENGTYGGEQTVSKKNVPVCDTDHRKDQEQEPKTTVQTFGEKEESEARTQTVWTQIVWLLIILAVVAYGGLAASWRNHDRTDSLSRVKETQTRAERQRETENEAVTAEAVTERVSEKVTEKKEINWDDIPAYAALDYVTLGQYKDLTIIPAEPGNVKFELSTYAGAYQEFKMRLVDQYVCRAEEEGMELNDMLSLELGMTEDEFTVEIEKAYAVLLAQIYENSEISGYPPDNLLSRMRCVEHENKLDAEEAGMEVNEWIISTSNMTEEEYMVLAEKRQKEILTQEMILQAIAETENLDVTDEEYKKKRTEYRKLFGMDRDNIPEDDGEEWIRYQMRIDKAMDFLVDNTTFILGD